MAALPCILVPPSLAPSHLNTCAVCLELDALRFAKLVEYHVADAPDLEYLFAYYHKDNLDPARIAEVRDRVVSLCMGVN